MILAAICRHNSYLFSKVNQPPAATLSSLASRHPSVLKSRLLSLSLSLFHLLIPLQFSQLIGSSILGIHATLIRTNPIGPISGNDSSGELRALTLSLSISRMPAVALFVFDNLGNFRRLFELAPLITEIISKILRLSAAVITATVVIVD